MPGLEVAYLPYINSVQWGRTEMERFRTLVARPTPVSGGGPGILPLLQPMQSIRT